MIRILFFTTLFVFSSNAWTQNVLVIDKQENNKALFDDKNSYSLLSILKNNLGILGYYELEGIGIEKVSQLRNNGYGASISRFVFPVSGGPLKDMYGEDSVAFINDGYNFVYAPPDTIYCDLNEISRMTLEYESGDGSIKNRLTRINLWKLYSGDSKMTRVYSSEAKDLLRLDAFKHVTKLSSELSKSLSDLSNPESFWSIMKKAPEQISKKEASDNEKVDLFLETKHQYFLPDYGELYWVAIANRFSDRIHRITSEEGLHTYSEDDDPVLKMPFVPLDSARIEGTEEFEQVHNQFNSCYFSYYHSDTPLIDEDPESPDFGYELITIDSNGMESFVYPEPEKVYFWVDYDDAEFFVSEDIQYSSEFNSSITQIEQVFVTKQIGEGKPKLISYFSLTDEHRDFFKEHPFTVIESQQWHKDLIKAMNGRKGHYNLSKKCQLKKYNKKFN